ncbi:MAG: nucleotide exchange factor GrpE, partial [Pseudomonadota bacterium]|nr:nucleotide exchange factor GrpE [Pseudomonadota bacterium]
MPENPLPHPPQPQDLFETSPAAHEGPAGNGEGDGPDNAELQAQLAELQSRNAEIGEQYLRSQAEMQNTRRRADEEISKARKYAVESFAESMLPVADSLEAS